MTPYSRFGASPIDEKTRGQGNGGATRRRKNGEALKDGDSNLENKTVKEEGSPTSCSNGPVRINALSWPFSLLSQEAAPSSLGPVASPSLRLSRRGAMGREDVSRIIFLPTASKDAHPCWPFLLLSNTREMLHFAYFEGALSVKEEIVLISYFLPTASGFPDSLALFVFSVEKRRFGFACVEVWRGLRRKGLLLSVPGASKSCSLFLALFRSGGAVFGLARQGIGMKLTG